MQESDHEFGIAHDAWLTDYRTGSETVYCTNRACPNHREGVEVRWESENGQGWRDPEECPECKSPWTEDKPEEG